MKVVQKLTLAFILCTTAVLAVNGLLRVEREVDIYERDRVRDHRLMGRALGEAIGTVWRSDGQARALAVLDQVNTPESRIHARWVWLDELRAEPRAALRTDVLASAGAIEPVSVIGFDGAGADFRYTYVPLAIDPSRPGAIELSESLIGKHRYIRRTILDTVSAHTLGPVVARTLELLAPLAAKRHVELSLKSREISPLEVDVNQIEQVVTNLVINAIQSMSRAGRVLVDLSQERACPPADIGGDDGSYVCMRVTDEGEGIARENLLHVFEPFFTTKDVGEGTGLGLSVAYGIVRDHGGWIAVESELGKGSQFAVYLPAGA